MSRNELKRSISFYENIDKGLKYELKKGLTADSTHNAALFENELAQMFKKQKILLSNLLFGLHVQCTAVNWVFGCVFLRTLQ